MREKGRMLVFRRARHALAGGVLAAATIVAAAHAATSMATKKDESFQTSVPNAILMDPESDSILFEKNGDQLVAPASLAKLMTLEYAFNEIKQGRLKLEDEVFISENAWRKGGAPSHGSTMYAAIHSRVKVDDLLHGIIVDSANDACIALAESMAGNETTFAALLTKRAREIGLEKSTFTNATGYSDPNLRVTVRELAQLARHIMHTYPDFYPYFAEREFTWNNIHQLNRNPLLAMGIGADGLKTGETAEAGSNLVGSAVQEGLRLIVVVTGARSEKERAEEGRKMLDWGFHGFEFAPLVRRRADSRRGQGVRRQHQLRSARWARHHPADDAAKCQRAADRTHRLHRSGAGADLSWATDRQAQSVARREPGAGSAAPGGRRCRHRNDAAAGDGCRHGVDDRSVSGRRRSAMMGLLRETMTAPDCARTYIGSLLLAAPHS